MTTADRVVVALALTLIAWLYAAFWTQGKGAEVAVLINGVENRRLSLAQNQIFEVAGRIGASKLEIKDGQVRFVASPCTGKQCIHAGHLQRSGEFAACLPNGVSVYVVATATEFDAINF